MRVLSTTIINNIAHDNILKLKDQTENESVLHNGPKLKLRSKTEVDTKNKFAEVEQTIKDIYDSQNDTHPDFPSQSVSTDPSPSPSTPPSTAGRLFLWGSGKDGRLGNSADKNCTTPNEVNGDLGFMEIRCGYHHTAGISEKGTLMTWGRGAFGQLGHGDVQSYFKPKIVGALGIDI